MKKAYLKELQTLLLGSVTDSPDVIEHFSTDASIFQITPAAVVYPQNTADIRKTIQFIAERTAAGKPLSLTPRGYGNNQSGGALGEGLQIVFPAHMNKLLRLDRDTVTVQPGISYRNLQQTLHTHGRYLPPVSDGLDYVTIGGAVANNLAGERSLKYGPIGSLVKGLKVVLADGSLIQTKRISARELNRKKGLATLEGEIYRKLDSLLLDNPQLIKKSRLNLPVNTAGYALGDIRGKDGSFDLTPVFIGSQGTLGLITEITLRTVPYNPRTTLVVGFLPNITKLDQIVKKLTAMGPCSLEMVDYHFLNFLQTHRPSSLTGLVPDQLPRLMILLEFEDRSQLAQKIKSNQAKYLIARHGGSVRVSTDPIEQVAFWKIRRSSPALGWLHGAKKSLPFIEDSIIPVSRLPKFLDQLAKILVKHDLECGLWGHLGIGSIRLQPALDLSRKKDVDKLFSLMREYYHLVIALGGSPSAGHNDSLLRSLMIEHLYGPELTELLVRTKQIFDPRGILNPNKKTAVTEDYVRAHLRSSYTVKHYDHLHHS